MSKETKQTKVNSFKFSISLECDDIERTGGVIQVETIENYNSVIKKINEAFEKFDIGDAFENFDIDGFGFDEFLEYLKKLYGAWIITEVELDAVFKFESQ